jgi:putative transposase
MSVIRKSYTVEFKTKVVREILREEKTLSQIASEYGTHTNVISRWRDQALAAVPGAFNDQAAADQAAKEAAWEKEREELYAEIGKLSTQLAWMKKNVVICLSRDERVALVDRTNGEISLSAQTQLLGLNRTSLYSQPVPPSAEEIALKHRIDQLYTDHPYYGSRRITGQLRREGIKVNRKAVMRHMHEMGLAAVYPGPNLSKRAHQATIYPYLLANVTASYPNHVWGLDITSIRLRQGWLYLVAILDWYSRYVLAWELDQTMQVAFVLEAMQRALRQAKPVICKSDQGSQFTSIPSSTLLKDHDVQISMDGRGRALDNIFTERLWRTIKYEEVYLKDYQSPREARQSLTEYLQFYNERRIHQSLDYRTPAELYFK